jgi:hypothetical protein
MTDHTQIERLDLVARAEATKIILSRTRVPMTFVAALMVLLAIISAASFYETATVRILAILAVVTTIMLWVRSRYAPGALAVLLFATVVAGSFIADDPDAHTFLGLASAYVGFALLLLVGYRWATNAMPFTAAHSKGLENERYQVEDWIKILTSPGRTDPVAEFSTKSFWTGYWTYRLLDAGSCWVIAKFKTRNTGRLLQCRVRERGAVRVAESADRVLSIAMGETSVSPVEASPEMRELLLKWCRSA